MTPAVRVAMVILLFACVVARAGAQRGVTDADLEASSLGRVVRVGPAVGAGRVTTWPL